MLAGTLICLAGALTEVLRRSWTVIVWHRLSTLQANSCLECQGLRASPSAARLEVHKLLGLDVLLLNDIGDMHLELDVEGYQCNGDMSYTEYCTFWSGHTRQKISLEQTLEEIKRYC